MDNGNYNFQNSLNKINNKKLLTFFLLSRQLNEVKPIVQYGGYKKWKTLYHSGPLFPPEYIKHNIPIICNEKEIILNKKAEEYATLYAKYIGTDYIKNNRFRKNFWNDWKKTLNNSDIVSLDQCDFSLIKKYLDEKKEIEKNKPKEEKQNVKKEREELEKKYKTAIVNEKEEPVGNFRIEPPGIFIGRGNHPKLGKIKERIYPEDIIINIGKGKSPEPPEGHHWKKIIHDNSVEWLAQWKDPISGKNKYIWLGAQSEMRTKHDKEKFDFARKLKRKIKKILEINNNNLISADIKTRQLATALYFIFNFALRIGNEKDIDEADTVGVSSLRCEHIDLLENNTIKLDFLGKDSIRYINKAKVEPNIYNNIKEFISGKEKTDQLFDKINAIELNKYLQSFMEGLTAKVFRTFKASYLFQKEINKINKKYENYNKPDKIEKLYEEYNKANAKVAILMNHQKAVPKNFYKSIDKINEKIKKYKRRISKFKKSNIKNKTERINKLKEKVKKLIIKKKIKIESKNISLETSKINYIDPRISIAFMKKHNIDANKIFSTKLQDKFKWAFDVDENFKF